MKVLLKIILAFVIILVVGLAAAYLGRNAIAGAVIPSVATSTLGVKVDLGSADISLGGPAVTLTQLDVGNPEGFKQPHALTMGLVAVKVDGAGSSTQKIVVDEILVDKLGVWFVQTGETNNISKILAGMQSGDSKPASGGGSSVEIVIKRMLLTNLEVNASLGGIDSPTIVLDRIELTNISSKGSSGGLTAELSQKVFETTMQAVIDACGKQLPGAITASVGKSLESAGVAIGQAATKAAEAAGKAVGEATKGLGDAAKGLGDIFGGKKE
jgi:hypothetical protein